MKQIIIALALLVSMPAQAAEFEGETGYWCEFDCKKGDVILLRNFWGPLAWCDVSKPITSLPSADSAYFICVHRGETRIRRGG